MNEKLNSLLKKTILEEILLSKYPVLLIEDEGMKLIGNKSKLEDVK